MGSFIADYHETEEALPLVYNLGRLSLEWNMVEQFFTTIIWELLGDYSSGMAITGGMGNTSKADVALRLSKQRLKDQDVLNAISFACKAFNILRVNRNMLIHSHSIFRGDNGDKPQWRRATGKGPVGHASAEADFEDLERLIAEVCTLGLFVTALVPFLHPKRRKHWRNKSRPQLPTEFPMPSLLVQPPEPESQKAKEKAARKKGEDPATDR
ncbi:hypothetical protein [Afipia sp. GAS231]|uniref:hypothetical protein n=1 Tax=Afipia sp. GAS231 TaxID=1882747 RepID=UPI00087C7427|nr:hypothetical protein [Afipia sp. GAS231]SDN64331.1 hypothetical protein SAMN05444050_2058 [Afipia sp. GAS231]